MKEKKENLSINIEKPNFHWHIGTAPTDLGFSFKVERNYRNRFKWWICTKLFLPGWYEWEK